MKILVINCSPRGSRSDCMKLTNSFLEGMNETAEVIHAGDLTIKPCIGCYTCWNKTPGTCIYHDDMPDILTKLTSAELVIWSSPLYCYGIPASGKAVIDRMLPLTYPTQAKADNGSTYHPTRQAIQTRHMLISGCGFPNMEHNYEALLFQFGMLFHNEDFSRITCMEAPLLSIPEAKPVADPYLDLVKKAGSEFAKTGSISTNTQKLLDTPMLAPDTYRSMIN